MAKYNDNQYNDPAKAIRKRPTWNRLGYMFRIIVRDMIVLCLLGLVDASGGVAVADNAGVTLPPPKLVAITSGPTASVSRFGAVGDGRKDDTAALRSAFNYLTANGGTLAFEASRTYLISKSLVIANAKDFKVDGNGATVKMADGVPVKAGYSVLFIDKSTHFAVTALTVDGNRANRTPAETWAHNILIRGSKDFSFSQVDSINGIADGFYMEATKPTDRSTYTQNGLFLNCRADNSFRQGMSIINGENVQVIGGAYTNTHGTAPAAGIDIESDPGTAVPGNHNILIRDVRFAGNDGYGVQLTNVGRPTNIAIERSYFTHNGDGGIMLGTEWTLIKSNIFEDFSRSWRGLIDLPAVARTNSNNIITENSFNNIHTNNAIIYAHRYSGVNNRVYRNNFYKIDGPIIQSYTTGTSAQDNTITTTPTYPVPAGADGLFE
jgi:hypothetical protein